MVANVFHVATALPTVKWESMFDLMHKKAKILFGLLVWVVVFVQQFAQEECFDLKMLPLT